MFSRCKYGDNCLACRIPYVAVPVRSQHFSSVYSPFQRQEWRFCGLECKFCPMECKFQPVELKTYRPQRDTLFLQYPIRIWQIPMHHKMCSVHPWGNFYFWATTRIFIRVRLSYDTVDSSLSAGLTKKYKLFFSNNSALQKDLTTKKHKITLRDA